MGKEKKTEGRSDVELVQQYLKTTQELKQQEDSIIRKIQLRESTTESVDEKLFLNNLLQAKQDSIEAINSFDLIGRKILSFEETLLPLNEQDIKEFLVSANKAQEAAAETNKIIAEYDNSLLIDDQAQKQQEVSEGKPLSSSEQELEGLKDRGLVSNRGKRQKSVSVESAPESRNIDIQPKKVAQTQSTKAPASGQLGQEKKTEERSNVELVQQYLKTTQELKQQEESIIRKIQLRESTTESVDEKLFLNNLLQAKQDSIEAINSFDLIGRKILSFEETLLPLNEQDIKEFLASAKKTQEAAAETNKIIAEYDNSLLIDDQVQKQQEVSEGKPLSSSEQELEGLKDRGLVSNRGKNAPSSKPPRPGQSKSNVQVQGMQAEIPRAELAAAVQQATMSARRRSDEHRVKMQADQQRVSASPKALGEDIIFFGSQDDVVQQKVSEDKQQPNHQSATPQVELSDVVDPITQAIRDNIIQTQQLLLQQEIVKNVTDPEKQGEIETKSPDEFRQYLSTEQGAKAASSVLERPEIQNQLHQFEQQGYQEVVNKFHEQSNSVAWQQGQQTRFALIQNKQGQEVCTLKETTINDKSDFTLSNESSIEVAGYRSVDFPIAIANTGESMHVMMALKDKEGKNIPEDVAVYFTAHYDENGQLVEVVTPMPVQFMGEGKDAIGYIERNGQIYTLPVTQEKYNNMMMEVQRHHGHGINLAQNKEFSSPVHDITTQNVHQEQSPEITPESQVIDKAIRDLKEGETSLQAVEDQYQAMQQEEQQKQAAASRDDSQLSLEQALKKRLQQEGSQGLVKKDQVPPPPPKVSNAKPDALSKTETVKPLSNTKSPKGKRSAFMGAAAAEAARQAVSGQDTKSPTASAPALQEPHSAPAKANIKQQTASVETSQKQHRRSSSAPAAESNPTNGVAPKSAPTSPRSKAQEMKKVRNFAAKIQQNLEGGNRPTPPPPRKSGAQSKEGPGIG